MPTITTKKADGTSTIVDLGNADPIMRVKEWAALIGVGYSSAKRMLANADGPQKTILSRGRIGIAVSSHNAWVRDRTRP
jgi:predicted DNA-binding transcriptional regulator AlpA